MCLKGGNIGLDGINRCMYGVHKGTSKYGSNMCI